MSALLAPDFTLPHVDGGQISLSSFRGWRVVAVVGAPQSAGQVERIRNTIRSRYGVEELPVLEIYDLHGVSRLRRGGARKELRKRYLKEREQLISSLQLAGRPVPPDMAPLLPVLIDAEGAVAANFRLSNLEQTAVALLVGEDGALRGGGSGAEGGEMVLRLLGAGIVAGAAGPMAPPVAPSPAAGLPPQPVAPSISLPTIAPTPTMPQATPPPDVQSGSPCPVCGTPFRTGTAFCTTCGYDPLTYTAPAQRGAGSAPVLAATPAPPSAAVEPARRLPVCPTHGRLEPNWVRCPYCGAEPVFPPMEANERALPPAGEAGATASAPGSSAGFSPTSTRGEPPIIATEPPAWDSAPQVAAREAQAGAAGAMEASPPESIAAAEPRPASMEAETPGSSVGATRVIRLRPQIEGLAYLIETRGEEVGRVHRLTRDVITIGRDPRNDIVLTDVSISAFHARIERRSENAFSIVDLGSTNGTVVNNEPVGRAQSLRENDTIQLGDSLFVLKLVQ